MKSFKRILISFLLGLSFLGFGQTEEPVKWILSTKDLGHDEYELVFKASISQHWHLYSNELDEVGPIPTSFIFNDNGDVSFIGGVKELSQAIKALDRNFGLIVKCFDKEAFFIQRIKINLRTKLEGYLVFMCFNDHQCLPAVDVEFEFELGGDVLVNEDDVTKNKNKRNKAKAFHKSLSY